MPTCAAEEEPLYFRATADPSAHLTLAGLANGRTATLMVDSGATGVFVHPTFAAFSKATITAKAVPREVRVIDGWVINTGLITHEAAFQLVIGDHRETLIADITNTGRYDYILGTLWLSHHDPDIRWATGVVRFNSTLCRDHCTSPSKTLRQPSTAILKEPDPTSERHTLVS